MKFKKLVIQNFLSIQDIEIDLDNKGLVLVQGNNTDDSNFKSNGAGKTSLNESISWVLYGRTIKGLKADEVLHKNVKNNCMVSLEIEDDNGDNYAIIRGRKHKKYKNAVLIYKGETNITGKSDKDNNEFIENLIQMTYDVFTATILYSSNSFKFTSSTDAEMKKSLDSMLNMEFWNTCLEETKRRIDLSKSSIKDLEISISNANKSQQILLEQQQSIIQRDKDSKIAYAKKKEDLEQKLQGVKKDLENLKHTSSEVDVAKCETLKAALNKTLLGVLLELDKFDAIFTKINAMKTLISESNGLIRLCDNNITALTTKASKLLAKLDSKKDLIGTACQICGSDITEDSLENATAEIKEELKSIMNDIKSEKVSKAKHEKSLGALEQKLETLQEDYAKRKPMLEEKNKIEQDLANVKANITQSTKLTESYERSKKQYESTINMLEASIKECDNPIENTSAEEIKNINSKIQVYVLEGENLTKQHAEELERLENLKVWLDPFSNRGIKSLLLDNVTPFINKRANYYLGKLTSGSIELEFKTQAENKSGDLKDKFTLEVTNKNGGDKYAANSDGERRRIDISVNLALQDLISSRSSKKINVAFFDECFDSLDDIGAERVIEILNENISSKSSIFVTTHNENLKAFFDKSITLVKKYGFTSLKENI